MRYARPVAGVLVGIGAALATVALVSGTVPAPARVRAELSTTARRGQLVAEDFLLRTFGLDRPGGDEVVLAVVNQADLDAVARDTGEGWPWPREFWAVLTTWLTKAGASVIAYDLLFTEPSRYPEDDVALREALAASGRVVLAAGTSAAGAPDPAWVDAAARVDVHGDRMRLRERPHLVPPTADIARGRTPVGLVEVRGDEDSLVRRLAPAVVVDGVPVATFATRVVMVHRGVSSMSIDGAAVGLGGLRVPLARDASLALRFRRPDPPRTPPDISFPALHVADLLKSAFDDAEGRPPSGVPAARVRGRIVVVGISAPGIEDVEITPVSHAFLGPELHATAIDDFLRGDFLDEWPRPGPLAHVPAAALALLVAVVAILPRRAAASTAAAGAVVAAYAVTVVLAYRRGTVLPVFGPALGAGIAFVGSTVHLYLTEGRQRRAIGRMFAHYLAPAVVEELQRHPERLRLGGERRTMTVCFSDIEGFTTVSESLDPERLVAFLNDYLTRCTDVILDSGGVIDKYEGDAIIAFWNAPLDVPDHAARACAAALACQDACATFRAECAARGLPAIATRIGINTGPMVVGNMGSARRFDFTVMGDAVNLASRLEGANKVFGTYTMVSDETRVGCGDGIVFRELGRLRVKGRAAPVTVHEVVGRPPVPAWIPVFESALQAFYAGRLPEAAARFRATLAIRPDDPPSVRYLDRISALGETPPPPGFDGVLTLTAK